VQILNSDRWRKVIDEFQQWLSVQVVYTPKQVAQLRAKLNAEVQKMSADELQQFLDQWDAKLKVLLGTDADEARAWLGQYMSAMADGYRTEFLKKTGVTDISHATAAQIEQEILKLRLQRTGIQQRQATFDQTRQQEVQAAEQANAAAQRRMSRDQTLLNQRGAATSSSGYQSHYTPPGANYHPPQQRFYVDASGQVGYIFGF